VVSTPREKLSLEFETARRRHLWAKDQIANGQATAAMIKFEGEAYKELMEIADRAVKADLKIRKSKRV
jgi:hypothetical protein